MTSLLQLLPNGRPARRKTYAQMNALKHGLRAEGLLLPGEDPEEFKAQLRRLEQHYQPVGPEEEDIVKEIASLTRRRDRAVLIETGLMRKAWYEAQREWAFGAMWSDSGPCDFLASSGSQQPDAREEDDETEVDPAKLQDNEEAKKVYAAADQELDKPLVLLAEMFEQCAPELEKVQRYETTIFRRLRTLRKDLAELQARRKSESADAARVIEVTAVDQTESERDSSGSDSPSSATKGEEQEATQPEKYELRRRRVAAWKQRNAKEVA